MKKYHVISNVGNNNKFVHDLTIKSKKKKDGNTVHKLYHSYNKAWNDHIKGVKIMTVIDTGDDYQIKYNCDFNSLGYDEAEYLYVMMKHIINFETTIKFKHKIVKQ